MTDLSVQLCALTCCPCVVAEGARSRNAENRKNTVRSVLSNYTRTLLPPTSNLAGSRSRGHTSNACFLHARRAILPLWFVLLGNLFDGQLFSRFTHDQLYLFYPRSQGWGLFFLLLLLAYEKSLLLIYIPRRKKNHDTRALRTPKDLLQVANAKATVKLNSAGLSAPHKAHYIAGDCCAARRGSRGSRSAYSSQRSASAFHVALRVHGVA